MNKPYFAKLLPVKGEIKEGDLCTCPHKGKGINVGKGQPKQVIVLFTYTKARHLCKDCTKVKLFLCSRDNPDKPLGEISRRAKWVKENDEFTEEQIGILYNFIGEDSDDTLYTFKEYEEACKHWYKKGIPDYVKNPPIAIKCPHCGTFM